MRYIFVVQGEGRGHLTQAIALSELLRSHGHEVVRVLVGRCANRVIPAFFSQRVAAPVFQYDSPSIDYSKGGKDGDILGTISSNLWPKKMSMWFGSLRFISDNIRTSEADVVVNFYELLMGFTTMFHRVKPPIVTIAHQFIVDHTGYKNYSKSNQEQRILRLNNSICSRGSKRILLLSLYDMEPCLKRNIWVVPPLLRSDIFDLTPTTGDYILGYMLNPAYLDEVVAWKKSDDNSCDVHLFWDKEDAPQSQEHIKGLWLHRINDVKFLGYMAGCKGYITTAGFESVCEAMWLGKPTMMIPVHFEQRINAQDGQSVGTGVMSEEYDVAKLIESIPNYSADTQRFRSWVSQAKDRFLKHLTEI